MTLKREDLGLLDLGDSGFDVTARISARKVRIMTLPRKVAKDEAQAEAILDWMFEGLRSMFEQGEKRGIEGQQYALRELLGVPSIEAFDDMENNLRNQIEHIENRM